MTEQKALEVEMNALMVDIIKEYHASGRKVTGEFQRGLDTKYESNTEKGSLSATLLGYTYLAGRGKSKKGTKPGELVEIIKAWMRNKGITQKILAKNSGLSAKGKANKVNGVAYIIAKRIHEEGTDKKRWLKIYEIVITPQRIQSIINNIAELNVNRIVEKIQAELLILQKNV